MLKFVSQCSVFGPIVSASGYGKYKLYTHGYGTSYVSTGTRGVSCDHYIIYVGYLKGYGGKTVGCAEHVPRVRTRPRVVAASGTGSIAARRMSGTHHDFLSTSTVFTAATTLGTRRGGISNKLTAVRSGGVPRQRGPVLPPNSLDTHGFTRRYATYRLYISIYPGRMLHPSNGLLALVRPRVSCRHNCYHPRYTGYTRIYPASTVRLADLTSGSTVRVNRTM